MQKIKYPLFLLIIFILQSCMSIIKISRETNNPFFQDIKRIDYSWYKPSKKVVTADYTPENLKYYLDYGYKVIGYKFIQNEKHLSQQYAINAASTLGSDVVLFNEKYKGTYSGNMVVPVYNAGKSYTLETTVSTYGKQTSESVFIGETKNNYLIGAERSNSNYYEQSQIKTTISTPGTIDYQNRTYEMSYYDYDVVFLVSNFHPKVFKEREKKPIKNSPRQRPSALRTSKKNHYESTKHSENIFGVVKQKYALLMTDFDSAKGQIILELNIGDEVKILESNIANDMWFLVEFKGTKGFSPKYNYNIK